MQSDVHKKLRFMQAELIKMNQKTVSMSGVVDSVLRKGLKRL
jgi:hypothetical protein